MRLPMISKLFTDRWKFKSFDSSFPMGAYSDLQYLFEEIEEGSLTVKEIDWNTQLEKIVETHMAPLRIDNAYCWLYPLISKIEDYDVRIDVLNRLKKADCQRIDVLKKRYAFVEMFDCMISIFQSLKIIKKQEDSSLYMLRKKWYKFPDRKWLDELALVYDDDNIDSQRLVSLIQEMYNISEGEGRIEIDSSSPIILDDEHKVYVIQSKDDGYIQEDALFEWDKERDLLSTIIMSNRHNGRLYIDNSIDLCKYIIISEISRQQLLRGDPDYNEMPTVETFNRKLRNKCFDTYIKSRFIAIKKEMDADNTLPEDPTEIQVYDKFYDEEYKIIKQAKASNQDNEEVIKFADYLLDRINKKTSHASTLISEQTGTTINVQGDLVQGNKHVGTHIDNVSPNAIGAKNQE